MEGCMDGWRPGWREDGVEWKEGKQRRREKDGERQRRRNEGGWSIRMEEWEATRMGGCVQSGPGAQRSCQCGPWVSRLSSLSPRTAHMESGISLPGCVQPRPSHSPRHRCP